MATSPGTSWATTSAGYRRGQVPSASLGVILDPQVVRLDLDRQWPFGRHHVRGRQDQRLAGVRGEHRPRCHAPIPC